MGGQVYHLWRLCHRSFVGHCHTQSCNSDSASESNAGASSVNGSFRVTFDTISSAPINIVDNGNCSDTAKVLKVQIEHLTNVGRISINCSNAANGGGVFDVSFDTNAEAI